MSVVEPKYHARLASVRRRIPLFVLIGVFAVCDVAITTVVRAESDIAGGILLAVIFSQIVMIAVWSAFGRFNAYSRTAIGLVLAAIVGLALVGCINNSGGAESDWLWFLIVISQWVAIHLSLWVVRLCFGWRLAETGKAIREPDRRDMQFGIRQLLAWTALVAVTLGVGRWLLPADIVGDGGARKDAIAIFCVLVLFTCLLAWPVIWASLTRRWLPLWLITAALCCVALTIAEIMTFEAVIGLIGGDRILLWIMNSLQAFAACVGLLIVRASGFRLVRASRQDRCSPHRQRSEEDYDYD